MTLVLRPRDWPEALGMRSAHEAAMPIAGGTDVMVAMNRDGIRPGVLLDLSGVAALRRWRAGTGDVHIGAVHIGSGVTYTQISEHLSAALPGLAAAAGAVGSRQVRNRATIGGSLGTASPAGDMHPVLLACGAHIRLASAGGGRWVPAADFYLPAGGTALGVSELIEAVRMPVSQGFQRFIKIGRRRGVVKAICSVAAVLDRRERRVRVAVAAPGMVPCRVPAAEELLAGAAPWREKSALGGDLLEEFSRLIAQVADPGTDGAATAAYRRHALVVLAGRGVADVWRRYCESES